MFKCSNVHRSEWFKTNWFQSERGPLSSFWLFQCKNIATGTSLGWRVKWNLKIYIANCTLQNKHLCGYKKNAPCFRKTTQELSHYNDERQYIDNAASSHIVTSAKNKDLPTCFRQFAVIFDNFVAIFYNFVMILHIQRWLYNDLAAIFYDF